MLALLQVAAEAAGTAAISAANTTNKILPLLKFLTWVSLLKNIFVDLNTLRCWRLVQSPFLGDVLEKTGGWHSAGVNKDLSMTKVRLGLDGLGV
jgi:hypothetical protein